MRVTIISGAILFTMINNQPSSAQYQYPFQNPSLPIEERVNSIVSLMTIEEKVACLGTDPSVPRLGIKGTRHIEGLHGVALGGPGGWGRGNPVSTTQFPQAYGMAETWDPEMIKLVAETEAYEARYLFQSPKYGRGGLVVRAPNADLGRDPRWGRTEECYGEDPFFNATMVVAYVKALQGDHPKYWKAASLMKHFFANSNEDTREHSSSNFDERLFREYYSFPFYKGIVEGGSRAYMAAYNAYNGVPCTIHPILKETTVKEWGNDGIICTDGGAYSLLVTAHKYFPDYETAAAACVKAGINQFLDRHTDGVNGALAKKLLSEADINTVIKGDFRVMIKLGMLDPAENVPYAKIGLDDKPEPWTTDRHKNASRLVTQKSIVLLKNQNNLLPLDISKVASVAVIGPRAHEVLCDWYSGTLPYGVSPVDGIRGKIGSKEKVLYAINNDGGAAVAAAKKAEYAIVCVGNHPTCEGPWALSATPSDGKEAVDRKIINLEQEELIKQVYQANPKTIVVLISSFPYAINWTPENVPAILHMTQNSQELGHALADVIFGEVNPGGKLIQTWPKSLDQLPDLMEYDIRKGRTYMYFKGEPLYPFGFGLSYSTFKYSNLKTSADKIRGDGTITITASIENTSTRAGDEVVQLYVSYLKSKVDRPVKALKGFQRVTINAGETKSVPISLKAQDLAYWDVDKHKFVVEPGQVKVMIGSSSADIKLEKMISIAP
jgi:beta-glucosidase